MLRNSLLLFNQVNIKIFSYISISSKPFNKNIYFIFILLSFHKESKFKNNKILGALMERIPIIVLKNR